MSESLRARALFLANCPTMPKTDTERLAGLVEATADIVRQAVSAEDLLDRWQMVTDYLWAQVRIDCADIAGDAL